MHEPSSLNARWRAFQLKLADQLKALSSPTAIVETATRLLAGYLGASHCWYTEVGADGHTFFSRAGWFGAGMPPMPSSGRIDDFGPAVVATLGTGSDFVVDDMAADARTATFVASYRAIMIGALLAVPIFKDGRWAANLNVAKPMPTNGPATTSWSRATWPSAPGRRSRTPWRRPPCARSVTAASTSSTP